RHFVGGPRRRGHLPTATRHPSRLCRGSDRGSSRVRAGVPVTLPRPPAERGDELLDGEAESVVYHIGRARPRMSAPRIVTLLFTDVEGSTRRLGALGDGFVDVIERHRAILTGAASARRGSGYPTGGDGCVFIFGSAGDAVAAAVEAQRALAAEPGRAVPPFGFVWPFTPGRS